MNSFAKIAYLLVFSLVLFLAAPSAGQSEKQVPRTIELNVRNTVILNGMIESVSVDTFVSAAFGKRHILPADQTLYLVIVSGGGYYHDAMVLKKALAKVPNAQIICKYCGSAAGMIFGTSNLKRLVIGQSELLMHEMYVDHVTAEMAMDLAFGISLMESSDEFNKLMYTKIGISKEQYEAKIRNTEWVITGEQIVKNNLADEYVYVKCDEYMTYLMPRTCL